MARMVRIEIVYDMDDEHKTLEAERQDWLKGNVDVRDILGMEGELAVSIIPVPSED